MFYEIISLRPREKISSISNYFFNTTKDLLHYIGLIEFLR